MLTYKGGAYVTDSVDTLRTGTQRKGWPRTGSQRGSAVTGDHIRYIEHLVVLGVWIYRHIAYRLVS